MDTAQGALLPTDFANRREGFDDRSSVRPPIMPFPLALISCTALYPGVIDCGTVANGRSTFWKAQGQSMPLCALSLTMTAIALFHTALDFPVM